MHHYFFVILLLSIKTGVLYGMDDYYSDGAGNSDGTRWKWLEEKASIDSLVAIATAPTQHKKTARAVFGDAVSTLSTRLNRDSEFDTTRSALIKKLTEEPGCLNKPLQEEVRKKLLSRNIKLFSDHTQPLFKAHYTKLNLPEDSHLIRYGAVFGREECCMVYDKKSQEITFWDLNTKSSFGALMTTFSKEIFALDYHPLLSPEYVCIENNKLYVTKQQEHFKGLIRKEDCQQAYVFIDHGAQVACMQFQQNLKDSRVRWNPQKPWIALARPFFTKNYESAHYTSIFLVDFKEQHSLVWKSDGWLQGNVAWSPDGTYLAFAKGNNTTSGHYEMAISDFWVEIYNVSGLDWIGKKEPQKKRVDIIATAVEGLTIDNKQFFAVAGKTWADNEGIFLLHLDNDDFYLTSFCAIPSVSVMRSMAMNDTHKTLMVHTENNELYRIDLQGADASYLGYLQNLYTLPLKDILLLLENPKNTEVGATIKELGEKLNRDQKAQKIEVKKEVVDFVRRFLSKYIQYGTSGLKRCYIFGCLVYNALKTRFF